MKKSFLSDRIWILFSVCTEYVVWHVHKKKRYKKAYYEDEGRSQVF